MSRLFIWSRDNPLVCLLTLVLVTAFFGYSARHLQMDPSFDKLMASEGPQWDTYEETLDIFGSDNLTTVYIKDKDLFSPEKLAAVEEIFYNLEDIPGVSRVDGLFNAVNFKGEGGYLKTKPLLREIPDDLEELALIREQARANPMFNNRLISTKHPAIALVIIADLGEETANVQLAQAIEQAIEPLQDQFEQVFQLGVPMIELAIVETILADNAFIGPIVIVVILILLVVGIRMLSGALLPLITAGISIVWTLGFMALVGIPINVLTWMIPVMIFFLGTTEDMHLLSEYKEGLAQGLDRMGAIKHMAETSGLAAMLTGLTTFLGFLTIVINEMEAIRQFGIAASFGLLVNPLVTFVTVPVFLRYLGRRKLRSGDANLPQDKLSGLLGRIGNTLINLAADRGTSVLVITVLLLAVVGPFGFSIKVDNDILSYFKADSPVRQRSDQLHQELSGAQLFYIVFDGKEEGAFKKAENLQALFAIEEFIKAQGVFDTSTSMASFIALINREMADSAAAEYQVPEQDELIAQYLLFISWEDIERFVSPDFSLANINVRHNISSSHQLKAALVDLRQFIETEVNLDRNISVAFTGKSILVNEAADFMIKGQVSSLGLILVFIFIILSILFLRIKAGLLGLVPNGLPILLLFGTMGIFGIALHPGTALVAACTIGIAVDDTIHLFVRYNNALKRRPGQRRALRETINGELRPVFTTSLGLGMGFAIFGFSNLNSAMHFGLLSAAVMVYAIVGDLIVTPVLLMRTQLITVWDLLSIRLRENVSTLR